MTSSGRQISDFGGVSLILAPPADARVSRCGRAPTRYQWCPRAPAGWIWVRTDADTRQATLDAAAIRNFIGIFVALYSTGAAICRTPSTAVSHFALP